MLEKKTRKFWLANQEGKKRIFFFANFDQEFSCIEKNFLFNLKPTNQFVCLGPKKKKSMDSTLNSGNKR